MNNDNNDNNMNDEISFFNDSASGGQNETQKDPPEKPVLEKNDSKKDSVAKGATKKQKQDDEKGGGLAVEVFSSGSFIVVKAFVAGSLLDDIDVSVTQDTINIRGKRERPDDNLSDGYYYQELYWGSFARKIPLPAGVDIDKVEAILKNGVLTIKMLKLDKRKEEKVDIKGE